MTNPDPHHETALMMLRTAGYNRKDAQRFLSSAASDEEWRLLKKDLLEMAAVVDAERDARNKVMREALEKLVEAIRDLADSSTGVAGLHRNGDIASWPSLLGGGDFSAWLGEALDVADAALTGAKP